MYEGKYNTIATHVEETFIISLSLSSSSMINESPEEYFPGFKNYPAEEDDMVTFSLGDILIRKRLSRFCNRAIRNDLCHVRCIRCIHEICRLGENGGLT